MTKRSRSSGAGMMFRLAVGLFMLAAPPAHPAGHPLDEQGRILFAFYSLQAGQLETARAHGLSALGPVYNARDRRRLIETATATGLPAFISAGKRFAHGDETSFQRSRNDLEEDIRACANHTNAFPVIWYLGQEELRHWKPHEMQWLAAATTAINTVDAGRKPLIVHYDPNHRTAAELRKTIPFTGSCCKGVYAQRVAAPDRRLFVQWSLEQMRSAMAAEGLSSGPVIPVLWMAADPDDPADDAWIPRQVAHDVFVSLIHGATGILVWSAAPRPGFERTRHQYFQAYCDAMRLLNGPERLGALIVAGTPCDSITVARESGPENLAFTYRDRDHEYPALSVLRKQRDGEIVVVLCNSATAPLRIRIDGVPSGRMEHLLHRERPARGVSGGRPIHIPLEPLETRVLRFTPP